MYERRDDTPTPSMEDYLEKIYLAIEQKGYVRTKEISSSLNVLPSSVTKMMQKLDEVGLGIYERYRGFILTEKGKILAQKIVERHHILEEFLKIIGVEDKFIYEEVEKMEHYISKETALCIINLLGFFEENPPIQKAFFNYIKESK